MESNKGFFVAQVGEIVQHYVYLPFFDGVGKGPCFFSNGGCGCVPLCAIGSYKNSWKIHWGSRICDECPRFFWRVGVEKHQPRAFPA